MRGKMLSGGGSVDTENLTAAAANVSEGKSFFGNGSDEEQTGTLPDMSLMKGHPGYSTRQPNVPIHPSLMTDTTVDTNGNKQIVMCPPHGEYPEGYQAFVGCFPADIGISEDVIKNGTNVAGIEGKYGEDGNINPKDVKSGKIGYNAEGRIVGEGTEYGTVTKTLAAGESYQIKEGFYSEGKITAKDLASQTNGTATAAHIASGKTATVKGVQLTGTAPLKEAETIVPGTADKFIDAGTYINGKQTIKGDANLLAKNIKPGISLFGVMSSMISKAAATINPGKSAKTIAKEQYLEGDQTIAAVTQTNLSAANIKKGVKVTIKGGTDELFAVTGTAMSSYKSINANAYAGSGDESNTFTMPEDGVIIYGGMGHCPRRTGSMICEVAVNGSVITDMSWPNSGNFYERVSTVNKSRAVKKGDVIKVRAYVTDAYSSAQVSAVCIY